jgi:hypothetical protein
MGDFDHRSAAHHGHELANLADSKALTALD